MAGRILLNPDVTRGIGKLRTAVEMTRDLYALTFSKREWNAIVRRQLEYRGDDWRAQSLPLRFGPFARERLGYDARGDRRSAIQRALANGVVDRLAEQFWQGWNPWKNRTIPYALWKAEIAYERQMDRMPARPTKTYFQGLRRVLKRRVKDDIRRRVAELSTEDEVNEKVPLVDTGDLRDVALSRSRSKATVTSSNWLLRVIIPQPHPTHASVGKVLRQVTPDELHVMARDLHTGILAEVQGAQVRVARRGRAAGRLTRHLTPAQRDRLLPLSTRGKKPRTRRSA